MKTASAERVKRSGMRAVRPIDKGTGYDVAGSMRRIARQIDAGEMGRVTDIVYVLRYDKGEGIRYRVKMHGAGNAEVAVTMAIVAVDEWKPGGR